MQDDYLSLVVGKSRQRTTKIQLPGLVPVRWVEPCGLRLQGPVPALHFGFVQPGIPYAREQIGLLSLAWHKFPS